MKIQTQTPTALIKLTLYLSMIHVCVPQSPLLIRNIGFLEACDGYWEAVHSGASCIS